MKGRPSTPRHPRPFSPAPGRKGEHRGPFCLTAAIGPLAAAGMLLAACSGATGLGDPGPCPTPAAGLADDSSPLAYREAVIGGIERVQAVDQQFRAKWDERRLRERREFRSDFAFYAHQTKCQLDVMAGLEPPPVGPLGEFGTGLRRLVQEYLLSIDQGLEAVETRNASAYEDWVKQVDGLAVALGERREHLLAE